MNLEPCSWTSSKQTFCATEIRISRAAPKVTFGSAPRKPLQCFKTKTSSMHDSQPVQQLSFPSKHDVGDVWGSLHVESRQAKIYIQIRNLLLLWNLSVLMSHGKLCEIFTEFDLRETNVLSSHSQKDDLPCRVFQSRSLMQPLGASLQDPHNAKVL